jgi:signal transduction histidine kinase/ligand-binding sensor domain-containing protein/DNA-binding response OmpR family regulator
MKYLIISLCLLVLSDLGAQNNDIQFLHLSQTLSQNTGECIIQDHKGFLWIGTTSGLNRYDGLRVQVYEHNPKDSTSISNNHIRKIIEDHHGDLWIATENGLNRYIRQMDRFVHYFPQAGNNRSVSSANVSDVYLDVEGRIWVAADDLCLYKPETDDFIRFHARPTMAAIERDPYHNFIYQDHEGRLWYGYWRELYLLNRNAQKLDVYFDGNRHTLGANDWHFHEMLQDNDGFYLLATNHAGLLRFRLESGSPRLEKFHDLIGANERLSDYRLLALFIDRQQRLWLSCENAGLVVFDQDGAVRHRFINEPEDENSISGNSIWSIYQDANGRLWFGIWNAGVDYIDPYHATFKHYHSISSGRGLSSNIVTSFLEDDLGNLWIGTDGGGLNYFDRQQNAFRHYRHDPNNPQSLSSNAVLALCFDDEGNLWAGTWNGGISIFDKKNKSFTHLNPANSGLASYHVMSLLNDGQGNIFAATWKGGLTIYSQRSRRWETYLPDPADDKSIGSSIIFTLYQDREKNIWVGTLSDGLDLFQRDESGRGYFTHFRSNEQDSTSISDNRIHSLFEDEAHRFWIGTSNGLNLMDREGGIFKAYRKEDGLMMNFISGITGDARGNLWVSSLKGISRFDIASRSFRHYDIEENLQSYQFNRSAVYRTRADELVFGGSNGFVMFHPDSIRHNPFPPPVVLTDLKIFNASVPIRAKGPLTKHISELDTLILSYRQSVFTFEFVALNFTHPEKNQYAFMMKGFEKSWNYVGTQRLATYTNLNAGEYLFRVKAANNDGLWNEQGISLHLIITPPFWKTWWAYLIYFFLVVGTFYLILRYRLSKERLLHDLELEHLKLEKLAEMDKIKSRFFSNVSHEIRTPIMLIVGPLENALKTHRLKADIKSKIELVIRNARRLLRLMNQLADSYKIESPEMNLQLVKEDIVEFAYDIFLSFKEYAANHGIDFQFHSNMTYGRTWFDPDKLDKIIFNLLSNAFKFTPDKGKILFELNYHSAATERQHYIEIIVQDSGIGIPADELDHIFERFYQIERDESAQAQGIGIGLHLTHELVDLLQGRITVESEPGHGSVFRIDLPVDTIDLERKTDERPSLAERPEQSFLIGQDSDLAETDLASESATQKGDDTTSLILLVDDDPDVQNYVADIFSRTFKIITVRDGREGFTKAQEFVPDLIISDVVMPKMDGYQLCQKLKNDEKTSHIPIILLTVRSAAEQKVKGIELGADDYIPKPFHAEELQARVRNLLASRRKLRESFRRQLLMEPKDNSVLSLDEKFLLRVRQEVENNLSDWKLDADALSHKVAISRIQLYRKLKGLTGQTVHEFIRTVRLKRAIQLLEQRKMKITEIAYLVGFNDLNYFSRCFRKLYGKSPSEYLASLRK